MRTLGIILSIVVALTTVQDEKGNLSLTLTNIPNNEG
jgi:type III secretory pathway component EscS